MKFFKNAVLLNVFLILGLVISLSTVAAETYHLPKTIKTYTYYDGKKLGPDVWKYTYNKYNDMVKATHSLKNKKPIEALKYSYTYTNGVRSNGKRISEKDGTASYTFDEFGCISTERHVLKGFHAFDNTCHWYITPEGYFNKYLTHFDIGNDYTRSHNNTFVNKGRLKTITYKDSAGKVYKYTYNDKGLLNSTNFSGNIKYKYKYNKQGLPVERKRYMDGKLDRVEKYTYAKSNVSEQRFRTWFYFRDLFQYPQFAFG